MTVAKMCRGCNSNTRHYNITYTPCKENIGIHKCSWLHKLFREDFCPCTECIVKVTCTEPKISHFRYALDPKMEEHKCQQMRDQVDRFIKYCKDNKITRY